MAGSRPVARRNASCMSRSRLVPGKTTMADFMAAGPFRTSCATSSHEIDRIVLDHGVGQELAAHPIDRLACLRRVTLVDFDLDILALPYVLHAGKSQPRERVADRLALRIEHARLQRDVN